MAKRPAPGRTKTRLTSALSSQQAADLYERFLLDTIAAIGQRDDCTLMIAIDEPASSDYFESIAPGVAQVCQQGATLGERLDTVMTACLDDGFEQVFALGSDSPDLPPGHLTAAIDALDQADVDVVFGPTEDGGYYLIGWKQRCARLVTEVTMSTPTVLDDTLAVAANMGLRVELAPTWYDVDDPADLDRLRASVQGAATTTAEFLATL